MRGPPVLSDALKRYGLMSRGEQFHLWIHADAPGDFDRARPLLLDLTRREPRYRLLLTVPGGAAARRPLRDRFPDARVLPPPANVEYAVRRFVVTQRVHGLVLLDEARALGDMVFTLARWLSVPVVAVGARVPGPGRAPAMHVMAVETGRPPPGSAEEPAGAGTPARPDDAAVVAAITRLLREARGAPVGLSRWWRLILATRAGRAVVALRAERLDDLTALRAALGPCRTLLCLGNGPSSEDPRLRDLSFDVLFRVNWTWRTRGLLTRPDVVFVGDPIWRPGAETPILGVRTLSQETRLLRRSLLVPGLRPVRYFTLARLPVSINERVWPARPTNGAAMIAMAAALAPARLIIAGMDLYADPTGAYPGDTRTANAYPLMHDRETELAVIETALIGFRGEVTILSEPLRRALTSRHA